MVETPFQMRTWTVIGALLCSCFSASGEMIEIAVFSLSSTSVRVSTECIDASVDTEAESVPICFYSRGREIKTLNIEGTSLSHVYEQAVKQHDPSEAFFGPVSEVLLLERKTKEAFLASFDRGERRLKIAPMVKIGANEYVPSKFSFSTKDESILMAFERLKLPQPNE